MAFEGVTWKTSANWLSKLPVQMFEGKPIKYLEIGVFYGANLLSVANSYAKHPQSELYAVDPWEDYDEYSEYKHEQPRIYDAFLRNVDNSGHKDRIHVVRGYSHVKVPKFEDNHFDIIYIDGNHEPEYALEDAVVAFRKLKVGGYLVFDDYGWGGPDLTQRGIDAFLQGYRDRIEVLGLEDIQMFVRKTK